MQFNWFRDAWYSGFCRVICGIVCGVVAISWGHAQPNALSSANIPLTSQTTDSSDEQTNDSARSSRKLKKLNEIVVVATRTPQEKNKVPASVSKYSAEDIVNGNFTSPEDIARNEVGMSANRSVGGGGRGERTTAGVQDYNIRGLTGNRILLIEDGIRAPDIFAFGGNLAAGRAFYDFDSLKSVELVKSSTSTLYGSGALGGVVSYTTKDPADFLQNTERPFYLGYKQSFDSSDLSLGETATAAARTGPVEYLLLYTRRDGREQGISASTARYGPAGPNPLDYFQNNLLGKIVYHLNDKNQLRLTGEYFNYHANSNLISQTDVYSKDSSNIDLNTSDIENRGRVSLDYQFTGDPGTDIFRNFKIALFFQITESKQDSEQVQKGSPKGYPFRDDQTIYRNEYYRTDHMGGNLQATNMIHVLGLANTLTYGGEATYTIQHRLLDGYTVEKSTGKHVPTDGIELYPQAEIPPSGTLRLGAFVQDQITPEKAAWFTVTPAVRFDYYSLDITNSEKYLRATFGTPGASYHRFSITPSLSTLIQVTRELSFYGNFAQGFRNPDTANLNCSMVSTIYNYEALPNPSLKPEQSYNFELGTRGDYPLIKFSVAGFYHYYNNFISFGEMGHTDPRRPNFDVYGALNIARAQIYGVEGRIELPLGNYLSWLDGFSITSAIAYTLGTDLESHHSLPNIDPLKIVNTLNYKSLDDRWIISLIGTWVASQTQIPADIPISFVPPSYFTLDLVGRYRFNKNALLTLGIYNLTNQTYWLYQNMGAPEVTTGINSGGIARFSEPGINARISLSLSF